VGCGLGSVHQLLIGCWDVWAGTAACGGGVWRSPVYSPPGRPVMTFRVKMTRSKWKKINK